MKTKNLLLRLVVLSIALIFSNCSEDGILMNDLNSELSEKGGKKVVTTGEDSETAGNNLSFPVIWSDGIAKELRGSEGDVSLTGTWWGVWGDDPVDPQAPLYSCGPYLGDVQPCLETAYKAYIQKDVLNQWQASNWVPEEPVNVSSIDWGDNLESIDWNLKSQVRVETVLYKDLDEQVTQYAMRHCFSWGEDEVHGLQTDLEGNIIYGDGNIATVYTPNARLTIQKLEVDDIEGIGAKLKWREKDGWTESDDFIGQNIINDTPLFNMVINDASDGPGFYNAEVNVKGKVIFGYTWNVRNDNEKEGYYRITFSFDETGGPTLNTFFDQFTEILLAEEEGEITTSSNDSGESGEANRGGDAKIDVNNNLTYMDILITPKTTGSGGGGNGGGGSGSGGGNH